MKFLEKLSFQEKEILKLSLIRSMEKIFNTNNLDLNFCVNVWNKYKDFSEEEMNIFDFNVFDDVIGIAEKQFPEIIEKFSMAFDLIKKEEYSLSVQGFSSITLDPEKDTKSLEFKKEIPEDVPDYIKEDFQLQIESIRREKISDLFISFSLAVCGSFFSAILSKIPEELSPYFSPKEVLKHRVENENSLMSRFYKNIMKDDGGVYLDLSGANALNTKTAIKTFIFPKVLTVKMKKLKDILVAKHIELGEGYTVPLTYAFFHTSNSYPEDMVQRFFDRGEEFGLIERLYDSTLLEDNKLFSIEFIFPDNKGVNSEPDSFINLDTKVFRLKDDSSIVWYYTKTSFGKTFVFTSVDTRNPEMFGKELTEKDIQAQFTRIMELSKQISEIASNKKKFLENQEE